MKKTDLMNIDGMTDEIADKVIEAYSGYIPKTRFDEINSANKEFKAQIEEMKRVNAEINGMKAQIEALNKQNTEAKENLKREKTERGIFEALTKAGARNVKAVMPFLDISTADDNGVIADLNTQIEALKSGENSFLFASERESARGASPVTKTNAVNKAGITRDQFNKMSYMQKVNLYTENPDAYKALTKESE